MRKIVTTVRSSLAAKLILSVGITLLVTISTWSYFSITYQKNSLRNEVIAQTERLSNTILLGTHYAMMLNSRDDIHQIVTNIARLGNIQNIRLYNKLGATKFSNRPEELEQISDIRSPGCYICHVSEPALSEVGLAERTRYFVNADGQQVLGMTSAIYNEPGCSASDCHFHPSDQKILGVLDVVVTLAETEHEIRFMEKGVLGLALATFVVTSAIIFLFVMRFVNHPIRRLIAGTEAISRGDYATNLDVARPDEMGQLAGAMKFMCREIGIKQAELNRQRDEYENLFNMVPCIITVQDRNYRLIGHNREFAQLFDPRPGDFCYTAYKGRDSKCPNCPVEKTFSDGQSHYSEETGISKDGAQTYWLVKTSPIRNDRGDIVAAMEVNLDITHLKELEKMLERSEKKYHEIFNSIPNPVFVLDAETLEIRDCNAAVGDVYGYERLNILHHDFGRLFPEDERERLIEVRRLSAMNRVKQIRKDGTPVYVDMWISPVEYPGRRALLVITSDITQRLETEQQLIQASKMSTLGEMATGVAHELNQPLSVIKTASRFFIKKVKNDEPIPPHLLSTMAEEIDSHVDRASKIINHMREFGRKSDRRLNPIALADVLNGALDIFSQQLRARGIEVVWSVPEGLPRVNADANRLEQVFINLLINARDAIEEKAQAQLFSKCEKKIFLEAAERDGQVRVSVRDTGKGIPPNVIGRIFEPFFTTKEVGKGTGLGLSISYQIIQDFGGSIRAKSSQAGGAEFVITFPAVA